MNRKQRFLSDLMHFCGTLVIIGLVLLGLVMIVSGGTVYTDVVSPAVEVRCSDCLGSGTVIKVPGTEEILILTAGHVVEESMKGHDETRLDGDGNPHVEHIKKPSPVKIFTKHGHTESVVPAEVVWYSSPDDQGGHDLALLKPDKVDGLNPAVLGLDEELTVGEEVWYCGSPAGLTGQLEKSIINSLDQDLDFSDRMFLTVNGLGWHGSSGSGIFVKRTDMIGCGKSQDGYKLVGVLVMGDDETPKSPCFCEPQQVIKDFLESYTRSKTVPITPDEPTKTGVMELILPPLMPSLPPDD